MCIRDRLVLADASILNKMSPFFAILGSLLILKEKISPKKAIIVLTAFIGCLFVIKPTFRNAELIPSLIGLLGGFGAGMAYTMVHKLGQEKVEGSFIAVSYTHLDVYKRQRQARLYRQAYTRNMPWRRRHCDV